MPAMIWNSPGRRARMVYIPAAVAAVTALLATLTACSPGPVEPTVDEAYLLGTIIRVTVYSDEADALIERVFERVTEIEEKMSASEEDYTRTEILDVNRAAAGEQTAVSPDTFEVLEEALRYSRLSNGAFDVTIWPLVKLWGIGSGNEHVPPKEAVAEAQSLVDYRKMTLTPDGSVILEDQGMGVDVGAIAKGYAADEAARILKAEGVRHALLDFGGNILVIGNKPDDTQWRIGVQRPDAPRSDFLGIVYTADRTIVTSGPYERFFMEDGVRYHHIIDPQTGYPTRNGLEQVTIVAERSIDADALSTTAYVLGLADAVELIEGLDGVETILVTEDKRVYVSPGLKDPDGPAYFRLTDEEFRIVEEPDGATGEPGGA